MPNGGSSWCHPTGVEELGCPRRQQALRALHGFPAGWAQDAAGYVTGLPGQALQEPRVPCAERSGRRCEAPASWLGPRHRNGAKLVETSGPRSSPKGEMVPVLTQKPSRPSPPETGRAQRLPRTEGSSDPTAVPCPLLASHPPCATKPPAARGCALNNGVLSPGRDSTSSLSPLPPVSYTTVSASSLSPLHGHSGSAPLLLFLLTPLTSAGSMYNVSVTGRTERNSLARELL